MSLDFGLKFLKQYEKYGGISFFVVANNVN